jgi:hypothetical protein
MPALIEYWKRFEVDAVERVVTDHAGSVISFGAGQSVHDHPEHAERVRVALKAVPLVACLVPSVDPEVSIRVLRERNTALPPSGHDINDGFVRHPANVRLATHVIATEGSTAAQVAEEIAALARFSSAGTR